MSKISELADAFFDEIRNPQLSQLAEEIEVKCREYGLRDIEFDSVMEMVKESLYSFTEFLEDDDEDSEFDDLED